MTARTLSGLALIAAAVLLGCSSNNDNDTAPTADPGLASSTPATVDESGLYVMNADGSEPVRIAGGDGYLYFGPAWSPDGSNIVVTRFQVGEDGEFHLISPNGSDLRPLSEPALFGYLPSWAKDGTQLAFVSQEADDTNTADIHTFAFDSVEATSVTADDAQDYGGTWSADGKTLFIGSNRSGTWEILFVDLQTRAARPLETPAQGNAPALSPDGSLVAFTSDRDGSDDIFVMNVDGSDQRNLTAASGAHDDNASWAPDGSRIVFGCSGEICIVELDTGSVAQLTSAAAELNTPTWAPDGTKIAFTADAVKR